MKLNLLRKVWLLSRLCLTGIFLQLLLLEAVYAVDNPQAQVRVSGVVEAEGEGPLPGVSILIKGSSLGTTTDLNGNYSIQVNAGDILQFSYISYLTQEIAVASQTVINVTLLPDTEQLEEVVVIGYSPVAREKVLGAVSSVESKDILQNTPANAFEGVQGRLAGVQILSNGGPGAGFDVRVRGIPTFSSGTTPLFVVDGQQLENIDNLDPNDIESLEVLKDGATAAIYGSRGANGVVLITTKSGKSGKFKVNLTANTIISRLAGGLPLSNTRQRTYYESIRRNNTSNLTGTERDSLSLLHRNSFDLQDLVTRTAVRNQVNLAMSGGGDKAQMYWNVGVLDEEGVVINSSYQRANSRFKLTFRPNSKLTFGTNQNLSYDESNGINEGQVFQQMVERIAFYPVFEPNGTFTPEIAGRQNPVAEATLRTIRQRNFRAQIFNYGEYKIMPSLAFKSTLGINFRYRKDNGFEPVLTQNPRNPIPKGTERNALTYDIQQENFFTYINSFGNHNINAFAGIQIQTYFIENLNIRGDFVSDNIQTFNNVDPVAFSVDNGTGNERHNLVSQFAGFNYDFNNKYLVGATVRRDGSSRFGDANEYGIFPSFTLGWRVSEESFIKENLDVLNNLLVRFSYGETGNERIGNYDFTSTYLPGFVYDGVSGVAPARLGNSDISWESTVSTNLGFDLGLFNNRLTVSTEFWKKETTDLLAQVPLPEESGFASIRRNVGAVENRGIDISIYGQIIQSNDFTWSSSFNISFLENEVTRLAGGVPFQSGDYLIEEGQPIGNIFGFKNLGIYQYDESNAYTPEGVRLTANFDAEGNFINHTLNGAEYTGEIRQLRNAGQVLQGGDIIWEDLNNDFDITVSDKQIIGNGLPKYFGGFVNDFKYKGFSFGFLFDFTFGNDLWRRYDETRNDLNSSNETPGPDRIENAWVNQGDVTVYPRLNRVAQNRERPNSFFVTNGDYIKLRYIRLAYDFPNTILDKLGFIEKLTVNATFNNLATWTNYIGYNPELGSRGNPLQPGRDDLRYPNFRSVNFGINANF